VSDASCSIDDEKYHRVDALMPMMLVIKGKKEHLF